MNYTKEINKYCETNSTQHAEILNALERETNLKTLAPQMLSGQLQGTFLSMLSKILQPKVIVEIGTFTGYSAICLAQGLAKGGTLHTIEANPELQAISQKYFEQANLTTKINLHTGKAEDILSTLDLSFDLVFIDAAKTLYPLFYDLVIDKVPSGGIILADNALWSGKVLAENKDADTQAIHNFNQKIQADERVENVLLPLRDGIMMIRKL